MTGEHGAHEGTVEFKTGGVSGTVSHPAKIAQGGATSCIFPTERRVGQPPSVVNKGAPSIADNWSMEVILNSGRHVFGDSLYVDKTSRIDIDLSSPAKEYAEFQNEDFLYDKTASRPIQQGEKIKGLLLFVMKGVEVSEIQQKGTQFILRCTDVDGNVSEVRQTFQKESGPAGQLQFFPGMAPFKVMPKRPEK